MTLVDKDSKCFKKWLKSLPKNNNIQIYLAHSKKNQLLKDILEPSRIKYTNIGLQYQNNSYWWVGWDNIYHKIIYLIKWILLM